MTAKNPSTTKGGKTRQLPKGAMAEKGLDKTQQVQLQVPDELITSSQANADAQADALVQQDAMASMVATLSTPVAVQAPTPVPAPTMTAEQMAAYKVELAKLNATFGLPETAGIAKSKSVRANVNQKNGITMPNEGTDSRKIWDAATSVSKQHNTVATVSMIKDLPQIKPLNDATIKTQFARWRTYNGIKGRLPTLATPTVHQAVGEYDGIPQLIPAATV